MTIYNRGSIVRAPFPHVEQPVYVSRPALVVSRRPLGLDGLLVWVLMITNAKRRDWPGDIPIGDSIALGLIIPSKIRTTKISAVKIASLTPIGTLDEATMAEVAAALRDQLFNPIAP